MRLGPTGAVKGEKSFTRMVGAEDGKVRTGLKRVGGSGFYFVEKEAFTEWKASVYLSERGYQTEV